MDIKKTIAIIPARGGSKRVPRKNILDFFGKPMIAWTIQAAIDSKLFDRVLVSTEDEEIAQISRNYQAEVPFLRELYFDDYSTVSTVTAHALEQAENYFQEKYEVIVQLMANCPIRNACDIRSAYKNFIDKENTFQISSFRFGWMNPWWAFQTDDQDRPTPLFKEATKKRSQDLPDLQCPTGAIWIAKVAPFKDIKNFYGLGYKFCELNWKSALDIDDYNDFEMASAIFLMKSKKSGSPIIEG